MNWADVDIVDLKKKMRATYESRGKNFDTTKSRKYLLDVYSIEKSAKRFQEAIDAIC
jgi:hypothetical protein